jgi:hypothetical protein
MTRTSPHRTPLPRAHVILRRHRLAPAPEPSLAARLPALAAQLRGAVAVAVGLWPLTAVVVLAAALVVTVGSS